MCHRNIRQRLWVVVVARKGLSVEVISEQRLSEAKPGQKLGLLPQLAKL